MGFVKVFGRSTLARTGDAAEEGGSSSTLTPTLTLAAAGTVTVDSTYDAVNVILNGAGSIASTFPTDRDDSVVVRLTQGSGGPYVPTFTGSPTPAWRTTEPDWAAMAVGDFVEVRLFTKDGVAYLERPNGSEIEYLAIGTGTLVSAATAETPAISCTLPKMAVGDVLRLRYAFRQKTNNGVNNIYYRFKIGANELTFVRANPITNSADPRQGLIDVVIRILTATTASISGVATLTQADAASTGDFSVQHTSAGFLNMIAAKTGITIPDVTVAGKILTLTVQHAVNHADNAVIPIDYEIQRIRA